MDTVGLHGVYSTEAKVEAEEIINSKKYYLNLNGENVRFITDKECALTFYSITK
jgi:hypothetical protein